LGPIGESDGRKFHSGQLHEFYTHQVLFRYPIRDDELAGHVAHMAEQTCVKGLGGEKKGNGALALLNNP